MTFQPFLIANYTSGLDDELPVWLTPDDAFSYIDNAYIRQGSICKRSGYRLVTTMTHVINSSAVSIQNVSQSNMCTVTASGHNLVDGALLQITNVLGMTQVNWIGTNTYKANVLTDTTFQITDLENNPIDSTNFSTYTSGGSFIQSLTVVSATQGNPTVITTSFNHGLVTGNSITFSGALGAGGLNGRFFTVAVLSPTTFSVPFDLTGITYSGNGVVVQNVNLPITGLLRFVDSSNIEQLLVCDTRRVSLCDKLSNTMTPLCNSDIFTGTESDYFKSAIFGNTIFFTNNVDNIYGYNFETGSVQALQPQYGPNAGDLIHTASGIQVLRDRLLLFRPTYIGTLAGNYPQRLAYSAQNDTQSAMAWRQDVIGYGGFVEAPTGDNIECDIAFRDTVLVGFDTSLWRIRSLPNPILPYTFERIDTLSSVFSRSSMANSQKICIGFGSNGVFATDGATAERIDQKIPQFLFDRIDTGRIASTYCYRNNLTRQIWWLYPSLITDAHNSNCLVYHELTGAFSTYTLSLSCLQNYGYEQALRLSDFDVAHNLDVTAETIDPDLDFSDPRFDIEASELLGGSYTGQIFALEAGDIDYESNIQMVIKSKDWNPFVKKGMNCRFGYVDLILSCDTSQEFNVSFFVNGNQEPYVTRTVSIDQSSLFTRQIRRVHAGASGAFHSMQISQSAPGSFALESTVCFFAPAGGRLR